MSEALWDRDDIAAFLGVKSTSVNSWLVRHAVKRVSIADAGRGGAKNLYDPASVRAARDSAPGAGYRS